MSTQAQRNIGEHIRRIAGTMYPQLPIMSGVVKNVNEGDGTCEVDLSIDGDATTSGIMINAVTNNDNGVLLIPAQGSHVWVAEIDGPGKWGIVKCSNVDKVIIKIAGTPEMEITSEHIKMNGGGNQGLVKVTPLVSKINEIATDLTNLKSAFSTMLTTLLPIGTNIATASLPVSNAALNTLMSATFTAYQTTPVNSTSVDALQNDKVKH